MLLYRNTFTYKLFMVAAIIPMLVGLAFVAAAGAVVLYAAFTVMIAKVFLEIAYDKYKAYKLRKLTEVPE